MRFLLFLLSIFGLACGANLEYSLIKKGVQDKNTVLIIGGIQGDEPGGFNAANLIATQYNIKKGSVWVVPNLNFDSIIINSRGAYGDMNRKFAALDKNDPDFTLVNSIKKLIVDENVSLIVHLHDGSGFYRSEFINEMKNPKRWGNSCIIDQEKLEGSKYGDLIGISTSVVNAINKHISNPEFLYRVKNTNTAKGDVEMLKSLTYYATTQGKVAFANEASKSFATAQRVYYHLLAIEQYLKIAGIEFTRNFDLNIKEIDKILNKEIDLNIFDDKFFLSLREPRAKIGYVPLPKNEKIKYVANNPLAVLVGANSGSFNVYFGNRLLTKLTPEYFEYSNVLSQITANIDGNETKVNLGSKVFAQKSIRIRAEKNVRVNVIGFNSKKSSEDEIDIAKTDIRRNFSIDKAGKIFRVEFYETKSGEKDKFIGMFLVEFAFLDGKIKVA